MSEAKLCVCPTGMAGHWATCPAAPSEPPAVPDLMGALRQSVCRHLTWSVNTETGATHCAHCGVTPPKPPAEAQQDDDDEVATVGQAILHELLHTTRQPNSGALALDLARAALAARPTAGTETLQRVRELVNDLEADAGRAYQRSCGAYRDEGSDGQYRAYEDAADRLRAALGGKH